MAAAFRAIPACGETNDAIRSPNLSSRSRSHRHQPSHGWPSLVPTVRRKTVGSHEQYQQLHEEAMVWRVPINHTCRSPNLMTICHFLPSKRHCLQTASLCEFSISTKLIVCFSLNILIVDIHALFNIWDILLSCVCLLFLLVLRFAVVTGVRKLLKATYLLTYLWRPSTLRRQQRGLLIGWRNIVCSNKS